MRPERPDVHPPYVIASRNSSRRPKLSLFQQTLLETDELFYKTFPAARPPPQHNQSQPIWLLHDSVADFPSCGFELDHLPSSDTQSPTHRVDGTQHAPHYYALYNQLTPRMPPGGTQYESSPNPAPPTLHIATSPPPDIQYLLQYHQPQQHSPALDSLASPESFSDSPHPLYHTPPHFVSSPSISSPNHANFPVPVTPPALVPSPFSPVHTEPEQRFFTDQQYSPSSVPPSRRAIQHPTASYRSQRRYSPQYNRSPHQAHNSGESGSAHSVSMPVMEWTTTPSPHTTMNANVGSSIANAVNDIAPAAVQPVATVAPASVSSPSSSPEARPLLSEPIPGSSQATTGGNSRRNPDKKPALACVFCRGRKIACGPPLKDSDGKTCNSCSQCQRRSLPCQYPTESRRGMRKKPTTTSTTSSTSNSAKVKRNANTSHNPKAGTDPDNHKSVVKNKRR